MINRPFTFNTGSTINGTKQVGYIAAITGNTIDTTQSWTMGPNEEVGYIICRPYPTKIAKNIVSDGLILQLDAANKNSYPGSGNIWYDISGNNANANLLNSPVWNDTGYFSFDGISQGADGVNVSQNYVDLMIGLNSGGESGTGFEMIFSKYNDYDKSFRTYYGSFKHTSTDVNDWNYGQESHDFVNGTYITSNQSITNSWNIVRLVNQNTTFEPPFIYSISSDFLSRRYKGSIAFILCYNRILSNSEVLQNYNAYKGRFGL